MGVSFKVSKTGTRFRPKPSLQSETNLTADDVSQSSRDSSRIVRRDESNARKLEGGFIEGGEKVAGVSGSSMSSEEQLVVKESEVSFTLNLFLDGYSIGKPSENDTPNQSVQDVPKLLHPYDRTSETLFSAIESGRLPGDILDDIPCKYIDGALYCEVRDYRKCASEPGSGSLLTDGCPIVSKVCLRMSLENVVKDIPSISDNSWTYGDLMEVESRILKVLQPQLLLDPTPKLDRLCKNPVPTKLDLALCSLRRKRLRQIPEVTVTSNSKTHGKKICIDRVPESSNCRLGDSGIISGNIMAENVHGNLSSNVLALRANSFSDASVTTHLVPNQIGYQMGVGTPRSTQDHGSGPVVNSSGASPAGQDVMITYGDNMNSSTSLQRKRENQDGPLSPLSNLNKRARPMPVGLEGMQQQQIGPHMDSFRGSELNWKNALLQQQAMARGMQYANTGNQKFSQQVFEGVLNQDAGAAPFSAGQQGMRYTPKEEQFETAKLDGSELSGGRNDMQMVEAETNHLNPQQSRHQQRLPQHALMRSNFPQASWNNLGQHAEKDGRKEDQLQKRKSAQSPRLSTGTLVQSPLSSKSGELSSGSGGPQFGTGPTSAAAGVSQKEKTAISSMNAVCGTQTSSANDSLQRQHQAQLAAKRRSNSLPKTPAMSGVASPASVSNMSMPLNASSPSVGTPALVDKETLERFSKIDMVTKRHQLNCKRNKVDNYPKGKPNAYSPQMLMACLSSPSNNEDFKDDVEKPLSKSLVGGNMNVLKTRVIAVGHPERIVQGTSISYVNRYRTRMIMSERPNDGTVAMLYGEVDEGDFHAAEHAVEHDVEERLPKLPTAHYADLLGKQFRKLMEHEGYAVEQRVQPKQHMTVAPGNQSNTAGMPPNNSAVEMQQYAEAVPSQPSNDAVKPSNSGNTSLNSSQNLLANSRMLPPGTTQALQMSQGLISGVSMPPRPQLSDSQSSLPQQQQQQQQPNQLIQQQHPQFHRSLMLPTNPISNLNAIGQNSSMQLGYHMVNKFSPLHLQQLQQQQQQQPQQQTPQMQRKMMVSLGTAVGMGNVGNNMVGIAGLGNTMGMGTGRGIGGTGISAPMTPISGIGNVGQNPMNLSQASNIGNASQHIRSGALAPAVMMSKYRQTMLGGPQSSIAGISGARQMHPGSAGLSMLGQTLNRANMNPMQRAPIGPMGPPKLMAGMNLYMNRPQQQLLQQPQLQQQQQLQQLQQQQQQDTTSSLQAVVSSPQVGSPSTMGVPQMNQQTQQQQASPQQMSQRTPMSPQQMSAGAIHAMSAGNPEGCPASPQLSSQTLGSVGSIANSPMDVQGVNKSNSVSNA